MRYLFYILLLVSLQAQGQALFFSLNYTDAPYVVSDADAQAYITAVEAAGRAVTSREKAALDTLVMDLKGQANPSYATAVNFWGRDLAYWPMFGGTAAAHAINLRSPGTYNLTFVSTPGHSSGGVDWNAVVGSGPYARTGVTGAALTLNSTHVSYYSRENVADQGAEFGGSNTDGSNRLVLHTKWTDNNLYGDMYRVGAPERLSAALGATSTQGFFVLSRTSSTALSAYRNGSALGTLATAVTNTALTFPELYLGALNRAGTAQNFSTRQCAFASVGAGMSAGEAAIFSTIINAYQRRLSRNVY